MKARPFDEEICHFLDKYETEDCVILPQRGKSVFPRGSQIIESYPPVLLSDGGSWLLKDLVALPAGALMIRQTISKNVYVPVSYDPINPKRIWDIFSAEIEAYISLTHLQGIIVPYLYTVIETYPAIDEKKSPSILYEHLDPAQFIPLGTWICENPVPKNSVIPQDMFEPITGNSGSIYTQLDIFHQVLESLLDLFYDNDKKGDFNNYNGLPTWDLVCIRTFLALRLIHVGGICHGNLNGKTILINLKTFQPVFIDFCNSTRITSGLNIIHRISNECDALKNIWLPRPAFGNSSSIDFFDCSVDSKVWWI